MSIIVDNISTFNWEGTIRGLRNPMNSWAKSDSGYCSLRDCQDCPYGKIQTEGTLDNAPVMYCDSPVVNHKQYHDYVIGPNDLNLCQRMITAGDSDSKFMRQIFVSVDITAPLYWWKEMDQYKVGTTTNSCSTMHKISAKEFTLDDFSTEHLNESSLNSIKVIIDALNQSRESYLNTKDKSDWWQMIQLLPSSYNQKRTWSGSYANLRNIYFQRRSHKLDEWREFCTTLETLPYAKELICFEPQK